MAGFEAGALRPEGMESIPGLDKMKGAQGAPETSFKDVLDNVINETDGAIRNADSAIKKLATGEIKDVHQVMLAMNEADMAFKFMMELRNKLMTAYREIIRTPS